jgi:FSR family fosmidomycin resistance protein-like MFS transporter
MRHAFNNRSLVGFMAGHFTNDLFMGVLTALLPILKSEYGLSNAEIGLIALVQTGTGSLLQPFFGIIADRLRTTWFVPLIILWDAFWVAMFGFAGSELQLLGCAAFLGVGSAAFHPYGASGAAMAANRDSMNSSLSLYTVAGTSGWALGPVVATALIALFGKHGTIGFLAIGLAGSFAIWRLSSVGARPIEAAAPGGHAAMTSVHWRALSGIIGLVMLRSWTFLALLSLLPIHFKELGFRLGFYNSIPTIMILSGAVGTLIGGRMADRLPGQRIIVISQLLSILPAVVAAQIGNVWVLPAVALFGLLSDSSLSITLLAAQRLLPGRTGLASGVILGLGFVSGSIGVPITGALADQTSIPTALTLSLGLAVLAALLSAAMPATLFDLSRKSRTEDATDTSPAPSGASA